ncbi:MAG: single-stranded DNA-binding protein [Phycisphaerae bacterium]|jgi:single-strand DNA-binding protein
MASFNRVILAGNLTRDPELSYLPNGTPVCRFGLAVSRRFRDRDGNQKEEVCFVDVTAFERRAETINQYMSKGRPILIEGRLRYQQWTDKEGKNRSKLDVVVDNFTFLSSGQGGGAPSGGGQREGGWQRQPAPARSSAPPPAPAYDDVPPMDEPGPPPVDGGGDSIPF